MLKGFIAGAFLLALTLVTTYSMPVRADGPQYGDTIGPVTPDSMGIRVPTTQEEYSAMTQAERDRTLAALYARLPEWAALVDAGRVHIQGAVSGLQGASSRGPGFAKPLLTSAWGQCQIQWSDVVGGSWMRGYAWTRADTAMEWIAVDLKLLRDGGQVTPEVGAGGPGTNVEKPTDWVWKNAWDHYTWTTDSWHEAQGYDGIWYLGPSAPCDVSKYY